MIFAIVFAALRFLCAEPVWQEGREREMNEQLVFTSSFVWNGGERPSVLAAASNPFRIRLNGRFAGYGPARGPERHFRLDVWPLEPIFGTNVIEIECAGYNCNSYYFQCQPSFLQAEVVCDGRSLVKTSDSIGSDVFAARRVARVKKVNRFTFQRMFAEVYEVPNHQTEPVALARQPGVTLLPRRSPRPATDLAEDFHPEEGGRFDYDASSPMPTHPDYNLVASDEYNMLGFSLDELEYNTWDVLTRIRYGKCADVHMSETGGYVLMAGDYLRFDSPCNRTGLVGLTVDCREPGELLVMFDEKLKDGKIDPRRNENANAVIWKFSQPGTYAVESLELCTGKYFQPLVRSGSFVISAPRLRLFRNALSRKAKFESSDVALNKIFAAAEETFAQNAVDAFTDCPSRERAGWLCDSFFTARSERLLCGESAVERQFLENFSIPESFDKLPKGMLPMCYPADSFVGKFIPSWGMFFVLELDEYARLRDGDRDLIAKLRPKVEALIGYLWTFRNSDGLLEKLPKWVFVEWSKANDFVQDISYPNNMVWASTLEAAARLYGRTDLAREAVRVREAIRRQSWTGEWFCDNAIRQADGLLKLSGECTETCQYYAFFFGVATPDLHPGLYRRLLTEFGPDREKRGLYPKIYKANAFIGNFLRLDWLSREGLDRQILDEMRGYFLYMADHTGTLWELVSDSASCCHGFESHVAVFIARNVVGLRSIDTNRRRIVFKPPTDLPLKFTEMRLPVNEGELHFSWKKDGGRIDASHVVPFGWTVE